MTSDFYEREWVKVFDGIIEHFQVTCVLTKTFYTWKLGSYNFKDHNDCLICREDTS